MRKPSRPKKDEPGPEAIASVAEKVSDRRITVTMPPALRKRLDAYLTKSRKEKAEFTRGLIEDFLDEYEGKKEKRPKPGRDPELIAKALRARDEMVRKAALGTIDSIAKHFRADVRSENDRMISNLSRAVRNELAEALIQHESRSKPAAPRPIPTSLQNRDLVVGFLEALQAADFGGAIARLDDLKELVARAEREYIDHLTQQET